MKNNYFFLFLVITYYQSFGQNCSYAESDLNYAYSHVKTAYDSNNLTHLKYYSKRSLEALERAKSKFSECNCTEAINFINEGYELLFKSLDATSYEDGRFYIKRAREKAQNAISELEICSTLTNEDEALLELEYERQKLEEQQKLLKQKEVKIKEILAQKEEKEMRLKKEKIVNLNEQAILNNLKAYNNMLSACECNSKLSSSIFFKENLSSNSIEQIKIYYINIAERITTDYLSLLKKCKN